MYKWVKVTVILMSVASLLNACANNPEPTEEQIDVTQVVEVEAPAATAIPTDKERDNPDKLSAAPTATAVPTATAIPLPDSVIAPLPERSEPRTQTSGTVPHVQIDVEPVTAVNDELFRLAYSLPGVEDRPTIVSLPGARGMWLSEDIPVAQPKAIVSGREFAHIHPDGSLHTPLPLQRALEVEATGWGERHPWADQRDGWEGLVMLYTPQSMDELEVTFQLIVESYNYVTDQTIQASDLD